MSLCSLSIAVAYEGWRTRLVLAGVLNRERVALIDDFLVMQDAVALAEIVSDRRENRSGRFLVEKLFQRVAPVSNGCAYRCNPRPVLLLEQGRVIRLELTPP